MKKSILILLAFLSTLHISKAQSVFGNVEAAGFDGDNGSVTSMTAFKGKLYAGMGHYRAKIFRSATGDAGTFTNAYADSASMFDGVNHLTVTNDGGGYIFAALDGMSSFGGNRQVSGSGLLGAPAVPSRVIRSADGINWENYYEVPVVGLSTCRVTSINMFKGTGTVDSVYISYTDPSGASHVVRNAIDANDFSNPGSWEEVCNFSVVFGETASVEASIVYNSKLYYSLENGRLYETAEGTTFSENTAFFNTVTGGSTTGNYGALSFVVHNSELYIGTGNSPGAQLWKTADGVVYDSVTTVTYEYIRRMVSAGGKVWMISAEYGDFEIGSYNGAAYTVENGNEFGASDLEANNNSSIAEFDGHLYIGVEHYYGGGKRVTSGAHQIFESNSDGGNVWRTCLAGPSPDIQIVSGADTIVCAGQSVTLVASPGFSSYLWNNGNTSQFLSTITPGHYAVSVVDVNGCRASVGTNIYNADSVDVVFSDTTNTNVYPAVTVCKGDSTLLFKAHPENEEYGLKLTNQDRGMVTPSSPDFASRQLTIEMWMKPFTGNNGQVVTEYDTAAWANNNHDLIEYYGGTIYVELPGIAETQIGGLPSNAWTHVVLRYDGTTLNGLINGVAGGNSTGTWELPPSGVDAFKIGYHSEHGVGTYESFKGLIRDVRIWNIARADADIIANMDTLAPGTYPNLIYHYMLTEGTGNVAHDSSGNDNHSVSVLGALVAPEVVTISPLTGVADYGNNMYKFSPAATTTYTATYTNSTGCLVNTPFTVTVPHVDFTGSLPAQCGTADAHLVLATAGSYTWTPTVVDQGGYFTPDPQLTAPAWYHVEMFAADGGCHIFDSIYVNMGPEFTSNTIVPIMIYACEGTDVTLDMLASGGTAPYTYFWQKAGNTTIDTTYQDSLTYFLPSGNNLIVNGWGVDAIGCPMTNAPTFSVSPTASTDLHGHISIPPSDSVRNGIVYVFKHQPGFAGFDTIGHRSLDANGDYLFSPLNAGDYLIKILPDELTYPLAVPTYYGDAFQWDSSLVYTHGCAQTDTANIQLVVSTSNLTGPGAISGYIIEGDAYGTGVYRLGPGTQPIVPFAPGGPLKGIDVKLGKNPGGGIQARTMSDTTGFYVFDSLPIGKYKIYVDIPNLPMDSTRQVEIFGEDSLVQNNYFADSARVYITDTIIQSVGIYSSNLKYENKFSIYPNPAKGAMYVNYELKEASQVSFEITNTMGQLIRKEPVRRFAEGSHTFIFDTEQMNLQGGVYFMSIITNNKKYTQRIVVID
ncbi:MAG TPA: LamG-like jellyroll fold domain-containing protein [Bacteroidia bacterium]